MTGQSRLERILRGGDFAVTGELGPPRSSDGEMVRAKARILTGAVDAANITDNQTAMVRLSSIASGVLALHEGLEPVIQMTCRDRNRLALQSDALGAAALGIRNILCLTGDHQKFGDHPQARGVFDIDSVQLVRMLAQMRDEGRFQSGKRLMNAPKQPAEPPGFFIGAAANPFGDPESVRPLRAAKKAAAGADFIQTQPIFHMARFRAWLDGITRLGVPEKTFILAGVMPV
ncbi:methylenetetrahydrofolate reductase, partial [bacterium]|nr:methylenetetrahydrofolate reductase [candidate division CSSED10-310 bacterium]